MRNALRYSILTLTVSVFVISASAQRRYRTSFWDGVRLTPRVGINMFYGDLVDDSRTSYTFGGAIDKEVLPYLSARLQMLGGKMKGTQINGDGEVYTYFNNTYVDFMAGVTFKPLDLALGYFKQRTFNPYLAGQVGFISYNTETWYGPAGFDPNQLRHKIEGVSPAISGALGVSYWVTPIISVNAEYSATIPFTDMVDGHQEWYTGTPDNITGVIPTDANDFYYTLTLGVSFLLNDSHWKNEPKYNRKAYSKIRRTTTSKSSRSNLRKINKKRRSIRRR